MRLWAVIFRTAFLLLACSFISFNSDNKPTQKIKNAKSTIQEIPGFKFLKEDTFSCGWQANTVNIYKHEKTGLSFVLLPGNQEIKPFLICQTEVTQAVWKSVMGTTPWKGQEYVKQGEDYPATYLSWNSSVSFCDKAGVRLPTAAEWDYAGHVCTSNDYCFEDSFYGLYKGYGNFVHMEYADRVGKKKPNAFGLYDLHGNIWEWCQDIFEQGSPCRIYKGFRWYYEALNYESWNDGRYEPVVRHNYLGFRPAFTLPESVFNEVLKNTKFQAELSFPKAFTFLKEESFTCGGETNTVKIYKHNKTGLDFVLLPGNEELKPFLISQTEVTQSAWKKVMGLAPWEDQYYVKEGDKYPSSYVSWNECVFFCKQTGLRLPSESEWEYACRAGTTTKYCFGDSESGLNDYAWFKKNTMDIKNNFPHRVRQKKPNAFGLYDIHGNVREWCQDISKASASFRVIRGGGWSDRSGFCRSMPFLMQKPDERRNNIGFRPAFTLPEPGLKEFSSNTESEAELSIPKTFTFLKEETFTCGGQTNTVNIFKHEKTGLNFVLLPGNEKIKPFLISQTEVTQAVWKKVMDSMPWKGKEHVKEGDDYPASYLSWKDCSTFCKRTGLKLPSETEWEYACRAGSSTKFCCGEFESNLGDYAWYVKNTWDVGNKFPHRIQQKKYNAFGLYDVHGNVWEWCQGLLSPDATLRIVRGGSWGFDFYICTSSYQFAFEPDRQLSFLGFRPAFTLPEAGFKEVSDKTVEEVVKQLKEGMTEEEVDEILRPVVVASAFDAVSGGDPFYNKHYELTGRKELTVIFTLKGKKKWETLPVGEINPLSKWKCRVFRPDEKELSAAIEIAVRHLNQLIAKEEDLSTLFRFTERSFLLTLDLERPANLLSPDGQELAYKVTAKGSYSTHRLVELYFRINDDDWKYYVIVDMTDRVVVPSCWEPTSTDIAMAKKIADSSVAKYLLVPHVGNLDELKVKVNAYGEYEYGPTRRIVVLDYSNARWSKRVRVDLDNGTLVE